MKIRLLLTFFLILSNFSFSQNVITIEAEQDNLNRSIANGLIVYKVEKDHDIIWVSGESPFKDAEKIKLSGSVANLDFTSSYYFLTFTLNNRSKQDLNLILETGRPITNVIELYSKHDDQSVISGDGISFTEKTVHSNRSALPLFVPKDAQRTFVLKLASDGEIISLPIIFWENQQFYKSERQEQFISGIFYGIFLFVIIIYFTFFLLLKDRLFLLYILYVAFSGLLQFALDGYLHEYVFPSGGYMTQHGVIFIAGGTVFFAVTYASGYLDLKGRFKQISQVFSVLVVLTTLLSSIPGSIYATCYPLCNGFSLFALIFLLYAGLKKRRTDQSISRLFMIGLSSLLLGAVIFILGNFSIIDLPILTQNSLKAGTLIEIICLSILMAGKYKSMQDEKDQAQKQLLTELEEKNRIAEETNTRLEQEVADRTAEIESQRILLKEKNEDFMASIKYAERIQTAILPHNNKFKALLPDSFVLFKPKDIVSGDFYWIEEVRLTTEVDTKLIVYATADCTGHGVPGAFVSILCSNLLKLAKSHRDVNSPGEALDFANREINETLNSEYSEEQIRDGMDVALCALDKAKNKLYFAGAKNGLYLIRNGEIIEYKGNRKAIGNTISKDHDSYITHEIDVQKGDLIYTFTDGIVDQFGGPKQKKFMSRQFKEVLLANTNDPIDLQKEKIEKAFNEWKGDEEQIDDVLVIGVRI